MSASKLIQVFVYGTLKRGQPNHHWLTNPNNGVAKFIITGTTVQVLPMIIGTRYNIPYVLDRRGVGSNIFGEIYEVDDAMFAKLDELEEYPNHYDRIEEVIRTEDGKKECWIYVLRKFPESFLERKFLSNYMNCKDFPYCERSNRDENIKAKDDINFDNPVVYYSEDEEGAEEPTDELRAQLYLGCSDEEPPCSKYSKSKD